MREEGRGREGKESQIQGVRGLVSGHGMGRMESMKMRTMVSKGENGSDSGTVPKEDFV